MSKEIFKPRGRLYENNDNDIVRRILPLSLKLNNKLTQLNQEYHDLNNDIKILNDKEAELKLKQNNFRNKQTELEKIEKKLKEKNSIKLELSNLIECYVVIIKNSQELLKNKVDEIIKRKVYLINKEKYINKILEVSKSFKKG
jgi:hypothetical protein